MLKIVKFNELIYEKDQLIKKLEHENNKNKEKMNILNDENSKIGSLNNSMSKILMI